ncbi:hypothetical protein M2352_004243 [Azospirillum fermentarium]|uniref:cation transporter n=1 Tax=Azospirillum fermentarium TaxID=1233114 RepID=UPI0022264C82|nr:cation transporter [Azospirillum fermentarium]MCW2248583.1 hypothetical protein [Azospirillum fermentarium]
MPSSPLLRLTALLRIAHHIPGRIRLKLEASAGGHLAAAAADIAALNRALTAAPAIRSVSVNPLALSCTIEYDPAAIPPSAWTDLLAGTASPGAAALLRLAAVPAE